MVKQLSPMKLIEHSHKVSVDVMHLSGVSLSTLMTTLLMADINSFVMTIIYFLRKSSK